MTAHPHQQVPRWLVRAGAFSWRIAVLIALGAVLTWLAFTLATVTAAVIVAVIVAATFAPSDRGSASRGWSGTASAAAVTGAAVLVGGILLVLLVLAFVPYVPGVVAAVQAGIESISEAGRGVTRSWPIRSRPSAPASRPGSRTMSPPSSAGPPTR